ncbi:hypothetical protein [Streptomyces sp. TLI_185]|nr:hypothetical protein [Streptomyces sp. TLI_185]RPF33487.1 hypothetical protein EDD92_3405 [Streptomyces sp. TLI_185]
MVAVVLRSLLASERNDAWSESLAGTDGVSSWESLQLTLWQLAVIPTSKL